MINKNKKLRYREQHSASVVLIGVLNDIYRKTINISTAIINHFLANVNSSSCSLYVIGRPSVCRLSSVCSLSVTFVHPTQAIEIFGNISTPYGTLAIC